MKPQLIHSKILQKVAIFDSQGNVLVLRRSDNYLGSRAGKWDLPGGNLDLKDLDFKRPHGTAIIREIKEETGLVVLGPQPVFVDSLSRIIDNNQVLIHATGFLFRVEQTKPIVQLSEEHSESQWLSLEKAINLDFGDDGGFHRAVLESCRTILSRQF